MAALLISKTLISNTRFMQAIPFKSYSGWYSSRLPVIQRIAQLDLPCKQENSKPTMWPLKNCAAKQRDWQ